MSQHVRIAATEDIPCIIESFKGFAALFAFDSPSDQKLVQGVTRLMDDPDTDFFVAVGGSGKCAGFLQQRYRYSLWLSAEEAYVEDVFVTSAERGHGLGRALMEAALARAAARGCRRAVLDIIEINVVPLALYESMGFSYERERSIFEGDPVTKGRQLFMVKPLP